MYSSLKLVFLFHSTFLKYAYQKNLNSGCNIYFFGVALLQPLYFL